MSAHQLTTTDTEFLDRLYDLASASETGGNLPIAAILAHGSTVLAEATNRTMTPVIHPGRHAEVEALRLAHPSAWQAADQLTLYSSLEPCLMCFGAIVLHRLGRVVFGAGDPLGGVLSVRPQLPPYVRAKADAIAWLGPAQPERFDALARRALELGNLHRQVTRA